MDTGKNKAKRVHGGSDLQNMEMSQIVPLEIGDLEDVFGDVGEPRKKPHIEDVENGIQEGVRDMETNDTTGLGMQPRQDQRLIAEKDPKRLFLSETKMKARNCNNWKAILGYAGIFIVDCVGKKGGLMLLWKEAATVKILSYSEGHIDSQIQEENAIWRFTGFYGNPEASKRRDSWQLLRRLATIPESKELPSLVRGDFNEICHHNDKCGGKRSGDFSTLRQAQSHWSIFPQIIELLVSPGKLGRKRRGTWESALHDASDLRNFGCLNRTAERLLNTVGLQ
ncbi:hypothetical protein DH2020_000387 [Rehmannia glutinosa]|uniref:Endonuclease/exonuclease/phosphatase domain-containing protein n=1 Tax=Rehmannia glutinosa TaxID=99300 RepID=A0ABR0XWR9_REHGL